MKDYAWWKNTFEEVLASDDYATLRDNVELFPFSMTGD